MHSADDAEEELHGVAGTTQKTEKLTNPATQRCVIAAAEGWVGASRARSPCSNTRIIYAVVILALSAGATSPTVLATKRTNSRDEAPTENAKENSPISHATRMEQGSGSPPKSLRIRLKK